LLTSRQSGELSSFSLQFDFIVLAVEEIEVERDVGVVILLIAFADMHCEKEFESPIKDVLSFGANTDPLSVDCIEDTNALGPTENGIDGPVVGTGIGPKEKL